MELYKKFNKYLAFIAPILFVVITFFVSINRVPFFDETHAYIISHFSLGEIFNLTRLEGHPILWYLLLKPLNNINWYPYPMLLINWIFMSLAVFVFWKNCTFSNIIKTLIIFSFPFLQFYGIVARPYGLGILITFLIVALYKKSLEKPILYASLLVLCANISALNCVLISGFGIIFIYDIIKSKKLKTMQVVWVFLIFLFGFLALLAQFVNLNMPDGVTIESKAKFIRMFRYFILNPFLDIQYKYLYHLILEIISFITLYSTIFILFKRDKKTFSLALISFLSMSFFLVVIYPGNYWHYYLYFILLISVLWIAWDKIKNIKFYKALFIALILINMTSYTISSVGMNYAKETLIYKKMISTILDNEKYKNAKLFSFDNYTQVAPGILVYLKRNNVSVYNNHNADRMSYVDIENIANFKYLKIEVSEFVNYLDKNKENYYIAKSNRVYDYQDFSIKDKNYIIDFDLVEAHPEFYMLIFKITARKLN